MENEEATLVEVLFEKAEQYGKTNAELLKLRTISKITDIVSSLISNLVIIMVILICIIMGSIGTSIWLGEMLGKSYYGYFAVAGFYLLMVLFLAIVRHNWIKIPLSNSLITRALK